MKISYFTFGQGHEHTYNCYILDRNCVIKITDENPRDVMIKHFDIEWAFEYDKCPEMKYFPCGIYNLTEDKWEYGQPSTLFKVNDVVYFPLYDISRLDFGGIGIIYKEDMYYIYVKFTQKSGATYNTVSFTKDGKLNKNLNRVLFSSPEEYREYKDTYEFPKVVITEEDNKFTILEKLLSIRDYFNDGWKPNWKDRYSCKYCIIVRQNEIDKGANLTFVESRLFSFYDNLICELFIKEYEPYLNRIKEFI